MGLQSLHCGKYDPKREVCTLRGTMTLTNYKSLFIYTHLYLQALIQVPSVTIQWNPGSFHWNPQSCGSTDPWIFGSLDLGSFISLYSGINRSLYLYNHGSMDPLILRCLHPQTLPQVVVSLSPFMNPQSCGSSYFNISTSTDLYILWSLSLCIHGSIDL